MMSEDSSIIEEIVLCGYRIGECKKSDIILIRIEGNSSCQVVKSNIGDIAGSILTEDEADIRLRKVKSAGGISIIIPESRIKQLREERRVKGQLYVLSGMNVWDYIVKEEGLYEELATKIVLKYWGLIVAEVIKIKPTRNLGSVIARTDYLVSEEEVGNISKLKDIAEYSSVMLCFWEDFCKYNKKAEDYPKEVLRKYPTRW